MAALTLSMLASAFVAPVSRQVGISSSRPDLRVIAPRMVMAGLSARDWPEAAPTNRPFTFDGGSSTNNVAMGYPMTYNGGGYMGMGGRNMNGMYGNRGYGMNGMYGMGMYGNRGYGMNGMYGNRGYGMNSMYGNRGYGMYGGGYMNGPYNSMYGNRNMGYGGYGYGNGRYSGYGMNGYGYGMYGNRGMNGYGMYGNRGYMNGPYMASPRDAPYGNGRFSQYNSGFGAY